MATLDEKDREELLNGTIPAVSKPIVWDEALVKLANELAEDLKHTRRLYEHARGTEDSTE